MSHPEIELHQNPRDSAVGGIMHFEILSPVIVAKEGS